MKKKILIKLLIAILLSLVIALISNSIMPLLGNDIAIGQLEHDDGYFIAMNAWHQTNFYLGLVAAAIWVFTGLGICIDVSKFIKEKYENKNGEIE